MKVKGIIKNNQIELIDNLSLAEGTEVIIEIPDRSIVNKESQWQKPQKVIGSWKNDSEIDDIFHDLDLDLKRHQDRGRDIDFEDFA
jgi:hypothetical protein